MRKEEEREQYVILDKLLKSYGYGWNFKNLRRELILKDAIRLIQDMEAREVQLIKVKGVYMEHRDMLQAHIERIKQLKHEGLTPLVSILDRSSSGTIIEKVGGSPSGSIVKKITGTKLNPTARYTIVPKNYVQNIEGTQLSSAANHVMDGGTRPEGRLVLSHFLTKTEASKYLKAAPDVSGNTQRKTKEIMQPSLTLSGTSVGTEETSHLTPATNMLRKAASMLPSNQINRLWSATYKAGDITNQSSKAEDTTDVSENSTKPAMGEPIPHVMNVLVLKSNGQSGSPECIVQRISTKVKRCHFCSKWIPETVFASHQNECSQQRLQVSKKRVCESDLKNNNHIVESCNRQREDLWKPHEQPSKYPRVDLFDISKRIAFQFNVGKDIGHNTPGNAGNKVLVNKCMECERWIVGEDAIIKHHSFSKLGICKFKY